MNTIQKKDYSIELLRIFACFLVIINHSNSFIFKRYYPLPTGQVSMLYFLISKCAVGIFFMISGAMLLGKNIEYKSNLKRFNRILIDIVLFSFLYYMFDIVGVNNLSKISISEFFWTIISDPIINPYWYLYIYAAIILLLPYISQLAKTMKDDGYKYLIFIIVITNIFALICKMLEWDIYKDINFLKILYGIGFMFLGHYMYNICDREKFYNKRNLKIAIGLIVFWITVGMIVAYVEHLLLDSFKLYADGMGNINNICIAASFFYIAMYCFQNKQFGSKASKVIEFVGGATFGTYLIHSYVIKNTTELYRQLMVYMNPIFAIVIQQIVVFVICILVVGLVRLIPKAKKLI